MINQPLGRSSLVDVISYHFRCDVHDLGGLSGLAVQRSQKLRGQTPYLKALQLAIDSSCLAHRWMLNVHRLSIFWAERKPHTPFAGFSTGLTAFALGFRLVAYAQSGPYFQQRSRPRAYIFCAFFDS